MQYVAMTWHSDIRKHLAQHFSVFLPQILGRNNMYLRSELKQPAEKWLGIFRFDLHGNIKMLLIIGIKSYILSEPIYNRIGKGAVEIQLDRFGLSAEHGESGAEIFCEIKVLGQFFASFLQNLGFFHSVNAEIRYTVIFFIKADQVISLVLPRQSIRGTYSYAVSVLFVFLDVIVKIFKGDFPVLRNRSADCVNIHINMFVKGLYTVGNINLSFYLFSLMNACESFKLFNKLRGFFFGKKTGRGNRVRQKL